MLSYDCGYHPYFYPQLHQESRMQDGTHMIHHLHQSHYCCYSHHFHHSPLLFHHDPHHHLLDYPHRRCHHHQFPVAQHYQEIRQIDPYISETKAIR